MKAYQVKDAWEEETVIVFAKGGAEARRKGAKQLGIDFEEVSSCTRTPSFDKYAGQGGIPAEAYINAGWWLECSGCYAKIDDDFCTPPSDAENAAGYAAEHGRPWSPPVFAGPDVWCCQDCKTDYERRRRAEKRARDALPRYLRRYFPGTVFVSGSASEFRKGDRNAFVHFSFPGSKWTADLTVRACQSSVRNGRDKGRLMVSQQDVDAWQAFRGLPKEAAA